MDYLKELVKKEATGSPAELAIRLNISERMVYRYVSYLNTHDDKIKYCKKRKTYKFLN